MKFGDNLKIIRKKKQISQEELASILGVSRQSVSKWETGENYPSMTNIMCLCDIFKCKINELVHEDFTDINSLDNEIIMKVVKFREDEQKKMKGLSKALYVIARIAKIISEVSIGFSISIIIVSFFLFPNAEFNTLENTVNFFGHEYKLKRDGEYKKINIEETQSDELLVTYKSEDEANFYYFANQSNFYQTSFGVFAGISLLLTCIMIYKMFEYVEKLFKNIHDNDTPFNMDNVEYIKKIALYLALFIFIPDIMNILFEIIFSINLYNDIELMNYVFVLIIISLAYIFKYGYEIQLDSKGTMYGKIEEK